MYYIYQLSYNSIPIYIGVSSNPVKRYMQHCTGYGCTVRGFIYDKIINGQFPDMEILSHNKDKDEAMYIEKETIETLAKNGVFLVNLDHNSFDNLLIIKEIELNIGWDMKLPRRYDTKVRICVNEYIESHNLKQPLYKILPLQSHNTDYAFARDISNAYELSQVGFINPNNVCNFRIYLREQTKHLGKKFITKTIEGKLRITRLK